MVRLYQENIFHTCQGQTRRLYLALLLRQESTWDESVGKRSSVPRKEVIQPHLPVRLPCYDFTPITDPTLDACPPCGLAGRLQVLPTFVV